MYKLGDLCLQVFVFYVPRGGTGQPLEQAEHGQGCWAGLPGLQEDHEEGQCFVSQLGWWTLIGLEKSIKEVKKMILGGKGKKERSFIFSTTPHTDKRHSS
jgi:hypothetical protein